MAKTIAQIERQRKAKQDVVEVRPGEYIPTKSYQALSREDKAKIKELGVDAFVLGKQAERAEQQAEIEANYIQLPSCEYVSKAEFEALTHDEQAHLMAVGIPPNSRRNSSQ